MQHFNHSQTNFFAQFEIGPTINIETAFYFLNALYQFNLYISMCQKSSKYILLIRDDKAGTIIAGCCDKVMYEMCQKN